MSNGISAFLEGLKTPLTGLEFMGRYPKLWRYGIWPVALNLLLSGLVLLLLIGLVAYVATNVIHPYFDPGGFFWRTVEVMADIILFILACGLAFAFWITMQIAVCGYFYGKLAVQVELLLGTKKEELVEVPLMHEIIDTSRESLSLVFINLLFLLIQIVPVIGAIVGIPGSYYFTSLALGREYWDYPLALRGHRRKEKHQFARRHRPHTLGLGTSVAIIFLIPIANAVLLTSAVTGAVLLHRKLTEIDG
jgi:CysZ protein